jgi:transcriptional regulator with XRE-family HTH domain
MPSGSRTALGEIIRRQRELAALPMRQLAGMVGISGPYLSQIENGLRAPSNAVLEAIADALQTNAEALYAQAGFITPNAERAPADGESAVLAAIRSDPALTGAQRRAMTEIYKSLLIANKVRPDKSR